MLRVVYYARAHVRAFFRISRSTGRIMQKFGVLLDPLTMLFTQAVSGKFYNRASATEHPFKSTSVRFRSFIARKAAYHGST